MSKHEELIVPSSLGSPVQNFNSPSLAPSSSVNSPPRVDFVAPDTPSQLRRKKMEDEEAQKQLDRIQHARSSNLDESDRCLICMNGFSKRHQPFKIPCSVSCNDTFVHEKCIYEWKERQQGTGSCPLCRAPLNVMHYVPPDALRSATFHIFSVCKDFVTRPIDPKIGMVRLYLRIAQTGITGAPTKFQIYLQAPSILSYPLGPLPRLPSPAEGDQLLMVGRKKFSWGKKSCIELTLDRQGKDFDRNGEKFIGHVQSNFKGLDHVGYSSQGEGEVVCIQYNQNRVGSGVGPRRMRVAFPKIELDPTQRPAAPTMEEEIDNEEEEDEEATKSSSAFKYTARHPPSTKESLSSLLHDHSSHVARRQQDSARESRGESGYQLPKDVIFGKNKEPYWLESIMAYSLDFHGRVTLPSNKNFILVIPPGLRPLDSTAVPGDTAEDEVCMQFGKVMEGSYDCYTMDVAFPLSVLQAAMIAVSACDRKLACA